MGWHGPDDKPTVQRGTTTRGSLVSPARHPLELTFADCRSQPFDRGWGFKYGTPEKFLCRIGRIQRRSAWSRCVRVGQAAAEFSVQFGPLLRVLAEVGETTRARVQVAINDAYLTMRFGAWLVLSGGFRVACATA